MAEPVGPPLLEARQIVKVFGQHRALDAVDFDARAGEVHALLGENGAGKSTLIKILTGALQPDGGEVRVAADGAQGGLCTRTQFVGAGQGGLVRGGHAGHDSAFCLRG